VGTNQTLRLDKPTPRLCLTSKALANEEAAGKGECLLLSPMGKPSSRIPIPTLANASRTGFIGLPLRRELEMLCHANQKPLDAKSTHQNEYSSP